MKKFQHNIIFPLLVLLFAGFLNGQTYTFTNAGAEGREGPTQAQIDANYSGTNLVGNVTINTRGIQEWVVPMSGYYKIEAYGAEGAIGGDANNEFQGGKGAVLMGQFDLTASSALKIVIGQKGTAGGPSEPGGGGGGSFVYTGQIGGTDLYIAAGGGGGGGEENTSDGHDGVIENRGTLHDGTPYGLVGEGGVNGSSAHSGAGWKSDGSGMGKGTRWVGGLQNGADGGFGGGASGQFTNGGGAGGGYSGGSTPDLKKGGGGGGSYNSGTDQNNTAGANEGHGKVTITFLGSANEAPVISQGEGPISKVSPEDTQVSWNASELNATDSDTNAAQLSWSLLSSPSNGTAIVDGNGSSPQVFTYQPNANYHGADSFSVQVSDGDANDSITINLTINPVDDTSVISGDTSGFLLEDSSLTGDLNATDIDGLTDGTYFSIASSPSSGSLSINPETGRWTYYPNSNTFGSETFTVTVTDDQNFTATQVINLNVISVNDLTSLTGDFNGTTNEDNSISGDINATDIDGLNDGSYFSISLNPSNGITTIDPVDGNWSYSPSANFHGSDSFTVTITDDQGYTVTQIINLTVNPIDDPTSITGDINSSITEDSFASGEINATDIDGLTDGSYFSISSSPASGALSLNEESGRWTYYPNSNTYGIDSFSVTITDDQNFTSTHVITITVTPVDDPASIYGDINASISEDSTASGDLNATDIDGLTDGSYFTISSNASNGTALIDASEGNWTYSPTANSFGSDSFTVTITDDQGNTATQAISVTINSVNDTTTITGDTNATIKEDSNASGDLNATDIDGLTDGSYFTISATPSTGTALIDPLTGTWSFSPATDSYGTDSFTVTVTDDLNFTATQVISVIINAVDDPTVITGDISGPLFLDHPVSGDLNATDIDGLTDGSYFSIQTAPSNGTATVDPTSGNWEYTPPSGFLGDTSFIIEITDDQGFTSNQSITIIPQYNIPVAQTGTPTLSSGGKPTFSGSIQYHGGLPILEVGFYTSSSTQFSSSEKLSATLENNASTFTTYLNETDLISTIFVRAFASNQNGETLGEIKRLDPLPVLLQWSSHAITLKSGWLQSDWFGTFSHYPQNWIFHSRLGWLYIPDTSSDDLWVWAPDHGWLWTQQGVFPHFYKNSTGNWIYLLENEIGGKNIYDYQSGLFK